ncbi:MAG: RNA methyltransferase [Acidobacteria bacterium]|nr:RNA methyltransferase [Acidobacteriota bacterium]
MADTIHGMASISHPVRIVLVRPRNPLNLLAASRAAANFGFEDVVVVAPYEPVWEEARTAPIAGRWLRQARCAASLLEAIDDRNWVLGTSCLARRQIEPERILLLGDLAASIRRSKKRDRIAILFGSEKRGLSNQELELCHVVIHIPTTAGTPSMNLGQAVAVCCYELRHGGRFRLGGPQQQHSPASVGEITRLVEEFGRILLSGAASRSKGQGKDMKRQVRLRQMFMHLPLTGEDMTLLLGVLRDLSWRLQKTS